MKDKNYTRWSGSGWRAAGLIQALRHYSPEFSRTRLQSWIKEEVSQDRQVVCRPQGKSCLAANPLPRSKSWMTRLRAGPQAIPRPFCFQDEAILVVDKPASWWCIRRRVT